MKELLDILKDLAESFGPEITNKARSRVKRSSPENLRLFDYVFGSYYQSIISERWYHPYHVAYSTLFAVELVELKEASSLVVAAIILHDIGYYSPLVDKENWTSRNSRIIHMQEGAGMAAEILSEITVFKAKEIGKIVGMVASHDNGYIGISTTDRDRLALRDADRIWVMHPLSFYKDWLSKKSKGEKITLADLIRSRRVSFYQESAPDADAEDKISFSPFTCLAREWRDRQFNQRLAEVQNNITASPGELRRAIEGNIKSELAFGRG